MKLRFPKAIHVQIAEPLPTKDEPLPLRQPRMHTASDLVPYIVMGKDATTHAAMAIGSVYATKKLIDTASTIAIIVAKAKFK
jgi:hypothetical protein